MRLKPQSQRTWSQPEKGRFRISPLTPWLPREIQAACLQSISRFGIVSWASSIGLGL